MNFGGSHFSHRNTNCVQRNKFWKESDKEQRGKERKIKEEKRKEKKKKERKENKQSCSPS